MKNCSAAYSKEYYTVHSVKDRHEQVKKTDLFEKRLL